jgi:short-subunit dehydrogenase
MGRFDGKRVLVTGASSGIGVLTAEAFAREGADLALVARGEGLAESGRRARAHGVEAHEVHADLSKRSELRRAMRGSVAALGGLDVAVLNAGAATFGPFKEVTAKDFDEVMDTTFRSVVDCTRALLPALEESGGTLVITASVAAKVPIPLMSSYVAAKHAVRGWAGALRMELAAEGSPVRVAMVHPGPVDTPFWQHVTNPPGYVPPKIYGAYSPDTVTRAIMRMAERPRREVTVGGTMLLWELAYGVARPILEPILGRTATAMSKGDNPGGDPGAMHEPTGDGTVTSGLHGRPSLWAELSTVPGRLLRAGR